MDFGRARVGFMRRRSAARSALALATAIAFFLQGLIIQTHIHGAASPISGFSTLLAKIAAASENDAFTKIPAKNTPAKDDSTRCPFCQAAQSAGSFVSPTAVVLLLPWQNVAVVPLLLAHKFHANAASHSWRGRAPPSA
jgi:hypothetical protein